MSREDVGTLLRPRLIMLSKFSWSLTCRVYRVLAQGRRLNGDGQECEFGLFKF